MNRNKRAPRQTQNNIPTDKQKPANAGFFRVQSHAGPICCQCRHQKNHHPANAPGHQPITQIWRHANAWAAQKFRHGVAHIKRNHGHCDQCHQRGINQKSMDQQVLPALQFITGFGNIFLFGGHVNFTISTADDFINRNQSQNRQTGPYCCAPMRLQSHPLRPGIWGRPPVTKCAPFFESGLCPHDPPMSGLS